MKVTIGIIFLLAFLIFLMGCKFAICPSTQINEETIKEETTAALGQKILNKGIYITPLEVLEDSRCPEDVQCIWGGQIILKIRLESNVVTKEVTTDKLIIFEGKTVTLVDVIPNNNTKKPKKLTDYRFTFLVSEGSSTVGQTGKISGQVTMSPICPMEIMPLKIKCAPKGYQPFISIKAVGHNDIINTTKTDVIGRFTFGVVAPGFYELQVIDGAVFPKCKVVTVTVEPGKSVMANISCDTGIR